MAYEVSTTIEIAATPDNVWAVLADLANYPKWHPMYQGVTGQLAAGSTLTITSTPRRLLRSQEAIPRQLALGRPPISHLPDGAASRCRKSGSHRSASRPPK